MFIINVILLNGFDHMTQYLLKATVLILLGAIAVLMAFILSYPTHTLLLFFIIPIPAVLAGVLFFLYESNMQKRNNTGNLNYLQYINNFVSKL